MGYSVERLQKYLAHAGIASRREAEKMIQQGLVKVNGKTITELGYKVNTDDKITVQGQELKRKENKVYLILNKPIQVVTTLDDPQKRTKVTDLLKNIPERVYPVGRLDYNTEGLLLLTNDGELAYRLTHPKFKVAKTYLAKVKGQVQKSSLERLKKGVHLDDGITQPALVRIVKQDKEETVLEIIIHEGRKRQVRRMCEKIGHPVRALQRIKFGPLELKELKPGEYRALTTSEILTLKKVCKLSEIVD